MNDAILEIEHLRKSYGDTVAVGDFNLSVDPGEFVTLLGPSGCGKTTTLRMIMGFIRCDTGRITIGGRDVVHSESGIFVPPESRNIAMVFQSYAVWPHMTVFDNVAYPNRVKKLTRGEVQKRTEHALELVNLSQFSLRHPHELSGGQQQRVALARALAMRANLLLLDEPLSNLDAKLRETMRFEIRELQRETNSTTLYVTHDQTEAMAMSDRIVVMSEGRIEQIGTPEEIYARPANRFVASFIGKANFLDCTVLEDKDDRAYVEIANGYKLEAFKHEGVLAPGSSALLIARPEDFALSGGENTPGVAATVSRRTYLGESTDFLVKMGDSSLRITIAGTESSYSEGSKVNVAFARNPFLLASDPA